MLRNSDTIIFLNVKVTALMRFGFYFLLLNNNIEPNEKPHTVKRSFDEGYFVLMIINAVCLSSRERRSIF